jgi:hypothetical protein
VWIPLVFPAFLYMIPQKRLQAVKNPRSVKRLAPVVAGKLWRWLWRPRHLRSQVIALFKLHAYLPRIVHHLLLNSVVKFCTGEDILSENVSLEYVLAYRCYLSKAQKKRVMELIQEIQPEFTSFISIMRRGNVQPPGPFLVTPLPLLNRQLIYLNMNCL